MIDLSEIAQRRGVGNNDLRLLFEEHGGQRPRSVFVLRPVFLKRVRNALERGRDRLTR
jgi:hypothetical protein